MKETTNTINSAAPSILAQLVGKDRFHSLDIEKEALDARRSSDSLFYQTNAGYMAQLGKRLAYLETITDWDTFEDVTSWDYGDIESCVNLALAFTPERPIDESLHREYTFEDERNNVAFAKVLIGLCLIATANRAIYTRLNDVDHLDSRFKHLFIMAYLIARETSCFIKYAAQYSPDGLRDLAELTAPELADRLEQLHRYMCEELAD